MPSASPGGASPVPPKPDSEPDSSAMKGTEEAVPDSPGTVAAIKEDIGNIIAAAESNPSTTGLPSGPTDDCIVMEGDISAIPCPGGSAGAVNVGSGECVGTGAALDGHPAYPELEFKGKWFFNLSKDSDASLFKYTLDKRAADVHHPAAIGLGSVVEADARIAQVAAKHSGADSQSYVNPVFGRGTLGEDEEDAGDAKAGTANSETSSAVSAATSAETSSSSSSSSSSQISTGVAHAPSGNTANDLVRSWQTAFLTGEWTGEFAMNKKSVKSQQHVKERFSLRCAARVGAASSGSGTGMISGSGGSRTGHSQTVVGVTGTGRNRFGAFEIEGHFDTASGHLRFAKYYTNMDKGPRVKKLKKRRKAASASKARKSSRKTAGLLPAAGETGGDPMLGASTPGSSVGRRSSRKRTASSLWTTDLGAPEADGPQHLSVKAPGATVASKGPSTPRSPSTKARAAEAKREQRRREKQLQAQRLARSGFDGTLDLPTPPASVRGSTSTGKGKGKNRAKAKGRSKLLGKKGKPKPKGTGLCDICNHAVKAKGHERLLECKTCGIGVHASCYGVPERPLFHSSLGKPDAQWQCDWCAVSVDETRKQRPACAVCLQAGGAVKTTSDLRWCCAACVYWTESLSFMNPLSLAPVIYLDPASGRKVPFEEIPTEEFSRVCSVCSRQGGICQPCAVPGCEHWMHPRCARGTGCYMAAVEPDSLPSALETAANSAITSTTTTSSGSASGASSAADLADPSTPASSSASSSSSSVKSEVTPAQAEAKIAATRKLSLEMEKVACQIYCKVHSSELLGRATAGADQADVAPPSKKSRGRGRGRGRGRRRAQKDDDDDDDDSDNDGSDDDSDDDSDDGDEDEDEDYLNYEGELLNGVPHGYGIFHHVDNGGHLYEGQWDKGKWHGYGVLSDESGRVFFAGEFEHGQCHGEGSYFHPSGAVYTGRWKEGKCHGMGTFVDPHGNKYSGMWKRNVKDGHGTCWYSRSVAPGGLVFDGEWRSDEPHGAGTCTTDDGFAFEGQFTNGYVDGRAQCSFSDGTIYKGNFRRGRKEGRGTLTFLNGAVYEGSFRDDQAARGSIGTFTLPVTLECIIDAKGKLHIPSPFDAPGVDDTGGSARARGGSAADAAPAAAAAAAASPRSLRRSKRSRGTEDDGSSSDSPKNKNNNNVEAEDYLWLIPIEFGTDMQRIHSRAGFTQEGM